MARRHASAVADINTYVYVLASGFAGIICLSMFLLVDVLSVRLRTGSSLIGYLRWRASADEPWAREKPYSDRTCLGIQMP